MSWSKDKWYTYTENGAEKHANDISSFANKALVNTLIGKAFRAVVQDNMGNIIVAETMNGLEIRPEQFSAAWTAILGKRESQFFKEVDPFEYAIDEKPKATTPSNDANELLRVMFIFKRRGCVVPSSNNFIDLDSYLAAIRVMLASEAKKANQQIEEAKADLTLINEVLK